MGAILALFLLLQEPQDQPEPAEPPPPVEQEKVVTVTATRHEERVFDVPYSAEVIDRDRLLRERQTRSLPDALRETPGVMVQKTSPGQGSPYIRGFTAFRNLLLIDGIRLNNSVFREGPNQYWNTVDPFTIDRLEIVKGPASALYGSDAIGGTVNVLTVGPAEYGDYRRRAGAHESFLYRSAEEAYLARLEASVPFGDRGGVILGGSWRDFDDIKGGRRTGLQPDTGYLERNFDGKAVVYLADDTRLVMAHQFVNLDDAWRTHKTASGISWHGTTVGNEQKRILDQDRRLTYVQLHAEEIDGFVDTVRVSLSWHEQLEEQFRVKSSGSGDIQGFSVGTLGLWAQAESVTDIGHLTFGAEWYHDNVNSYKRKLDSSGVITSHEIQGPVADDAEYDLTGVFLQDEIELHEDWELTLGVRYTRAEADADKVEDPLTGQPTSLRDDWSSFTGNLRVLYRVAEEANLFLGASQGFRAPNLSDLTRLDTARSNEIETPTLDLDPEDYYAFELGTKIDLGWVRGEAAVFYTIIRDMIVRRPTGNVISGDEEVTKANAGDGYVYGVELGARFALSEEVSLFGNWIYMRGELDQFPTSAPDVEREPLSRVQPSTLMLGLRWQPPESEFWGEVVVTAVDRADRLSTGDESDTQRIPPGGTPGYTIYTVRGGWKVCDEIAVSLAIENLSNKDHRVHGSGSNEPGTNVLLGAELRY